MSTTLEYPLSPKYIPNWTVGEALRELIANALDIDSETSTITWKRGAAEILDYGPGIQKSFWVIGEGNHGEIGQFGEGLKMAMLVLAREKRNVTVITVGYSVTPSLVYSSTYDSTVLALTTEPNQVEFGTSVTVECSKDEFIEARSRFLKLKPKRMVSRTLGILAESGSLYINGVYASHLPAMWGYNITDKTMANRDRTVLDLAAVQDHILHTLNNLNRGELILDLMLNAVAHPNTHTEFAEYNVMPCPEYKHRSVWRAAFHKVFGEKACLSENNSDRDAYVTDKGYTVVNNTLLPYGLRYALKYCKVPTTATIAEAFNNTKFIQIDTPLTDSEQSVLEDAKKIAKALTPTADVKAVKVVDNFPTALSECTLGLYKGQSKTIYILREILRSLPLTTGVLIHEYLHGMGYSDVSREFEAKMTEMLGELAVKAS